MSGVTASIWHLWWWSSVWTSSGSGVFWRWGCSASQARPRWSKSCRTPSMLGRSPPLTGKSSPVNTNRNITVENEIRPNVQLYLYVPLCVPPYGGRDVLYFKCVCISHPSSTDVHTVASLLKLYLRELPEPLVPFSRYQDFLLCGKNISSERKQVSLHPAASCTPS